MAFANRRSIMTLYSDPLDSYSHQVRIVLAEKGVAVDVVHIDTDDKPEELLGLNPYGTIPTLIDRDLILYEARIIMEYLDERFPHPPLMPVYPVTRAECRRMMYRIDYDLYGKMKLIMYGAEKEAQMARRHLVETLTNVAPIFANNKYFLSDEFTLIDCCLVPFLWRLPELGIEIPSEAKAIWDYKKRVFKRSSFQRSLSEAEKELRTTFA